MASFYQLQRGPLQGLGIPTQGPLHAAAVRGDAQGIVRPLLSVLGLCVCPLTTIIPADVDSLRT